MGVDILKFELDNLKLLAFERHPELSMLTNL